MPAKALIACGVCIWVATIGFAFMSRAPYRCADYVAPPGHPCDAEDHRLDVARGVALCVCVADAGAQ